MSNKNLIKKILREVAEERNLRLYALDWDDNILGMPTKIYLKDKVGNSIGMPTDHFAEYRHLIGKEPFEYEDSTIVGFDEDPFRDFTHPETFLSDTIKAVKKNRFSPSFEKFKETLIYANPFSIITARGHSPKVIKKGVKLFINIALTPQEKQEMINNIKDVLDFEEISGYYKTGDLDDSQMIDVYLDEKGEYYPVSSKEFGQRFKLDSSKGASSPEHNKKLALSDFLDQVYYKVGRLIDSGKYGSVSLGFSDDDISNVRSMVQHIEDELSRVYPEIHFVVKDTSEGGMKKIVISRINDGADSESLLENYMINKILSYL
jgi:hypothetical protein